MPAFVTGVVVELESIDEIVNELVVSSGLALLALPPVMISNSALAVFGVIAKAPLIVDAPPVLSCRMPP